MMQVKLEQFLRIDQNLNEITHAVSDKKALKMMAAEREMTIAAIIHEWMQEHLDS